jgi:hypothetical protein
VIGAWLEFGHDAKVRAEKACAKLRDQFFARALAAILCVAAEIAVGTMRRRSPMDLMPISA